MSPGRTTFAAIVMVMIGCQESGFAPTDDDLGPQFFHGASPGIAIVPASALTGPSVCRGGFGSPQCLAFPYDTGSNLAYQGNGFAAPAVALNNIGGIFSAIHEPEYANDGLYGNGASWIAGSANSGVNPCRWTGGVAWIDQSAASSCMNTLELLGRHVAQRGV